MDRADRTRYRQLANDAVIATFGENGLTARLAEALEKCVDELDDANEKCPTCSVCENHGDLEDDSFDIDVGEVLRIQKQLKALTEGLKRNLANPEGLAEIVEALDSSVDDLEVEVVPI